ncbi:MAG: hypothetical protein ACTSU5_16650 [Promethearchaeota archaeon]
MASKDEKSDGIDLRVMLDALASLPDEYLDGAGVYSEKGNILALLHDLAMDLVDRSGEAGFDPVEVGSWVEGLEEDQRRVLLLIIGLLADADTQTSLKGAKSFGRYKNVVPRHLFNLAKKLGKVVPPDKFFQDEERREELARKVLAVLGLPIEGETKEDSESRLLQVDSLEIDRIQREVKEKIRKAMEEAAKRAAAAKVSRE